MNNNEMKNNYVKEVDEKDNSNYNAIEKEINVEKDNEGEGEINKNINNKDNEINNFGKVIRKTDTPYEIPEDF